MRLRDELIDAFLFVRNSSFRLHFSKRELMKSDESNKIQETAQREFETRYAKTQKWTEVALDEISY